VRLHQFLRLALKAHGREIPALEFRKQMREQMKTLKVPAAFANRYINEGLSGGERKRSEILQMAMLRPEMAILDETDSGLDIDAVREVGTGINRLVGPDMGVLVITHAQRILNYLEPSHVHVLVEGRVVRSGGGELVHQLEAKGYDWIIQQLPQDGHTADGGEGNHVNN